MLAQSVALQHYEQQTLSMFLLFEQLHSDITAKSQGYFAVGIGTEKRMLMFRILAESSSVMTEVIVKIGLLERTKMRETAWKYEQYFSLWEGTPRFSRRLLARDAQLPIQRPIDQRHRQRKTALSRFCSFQPRFSPQNGSIVAG